MAWIELHQTLPTHRKILKLKRLLKIKTPQAVGHVVMLWLWSIDNAPDGDLSQIDAADIAEVCGWPEKKAAKFVSAMQEVGLIDEDMGLHDWGEYAGRLVGQREERREKERERKAQYRARKRSESNWDTPDGAGSDMLDGSETVPQDCPAFVPGDCPEPVPRDCPTKNEAVPSLHNTTEHNTTEPVIDSCCCSSCGSADAGTSSSSDTEEETPSKAMQAVQAVLSPGHVPPADPELARVMSFYLDRINATPSPLSLEELGTFAENISADVIIKAMEYALDEHNTKWTFIRGTLRAYKAKNIRTLADWQRDRDEYDRAKQQAIKRQEETGNANSRRNSQKRDSGGTPPPNPDPLCGFHAAY